MFDSGVGGLTVLHELLVALPHEDFLYLGDTARFPTASAMATSSSASRSRSPSTSWRRRTKLLVVACNSAAAAAVTALQTRMMETTLGVDVVAVVGPESPARRRRHRQRPHRAPRHAGDRVLGRLRPRRRRRRFHGRAPRRPLPRPGADHPGRLPVRRARGGNGARVLRAAARGRRRHRDPRLHALPARRAHAPAHARAQRPLGHLGPGHRPPRRACARAPRPRQPPGPGGRLPLPVHRRRGRVPRARHPVPADAPG